MNIAVTIDNYDFSKCDLLVAACLTITLNAEK